MSGGVRIGGIEVKIGKSTVSGARGLVWEITVRVRVWVRVRVKVKVRVSV